MVGRSEQCNSYHTSCTKCLSNDAPLRNASQMLRSSPSECQTCNYTLPIQHPARSPPRAGSNATPSQATLRCVASIGALPAAGRRSTYCSASLAYRSSSSSGSGTCDALASSCSYWLTVLWSMTTSGGLSAGDSTKAKLGSLRKVRKQSVRAYVVNITGAWHIAPIDGGASGGNSNLCKHEGLPAQSASGLPREARHDNWQRGTLNSHDIHHKSSIMPPWDGAREPTPTVAACRLGERARAKKRCLFADSSQEAVHCWRKQQPAQGRKRR